MTTLQDIFHRPATRDIGGVSFRVYRLALEQFDDALAVGAWAQQLESIAAAPTKILELARDSAPRQALARLVAGSLRLAEPLEGKDTLSLQDVGEMPVVTLAEAAAVLLEENLDFFTQAAPRLMGLETKIRTSTGSALPSDSSPQDTTAAA